MSTANEFLEEIRSKIGPAPRPLGWFKPSPFIFPEPPWVEQAARDEEPIKEIFRDMNLLWKRGVVVWGHLIRANVALFEPGEGDLPGTVIFSPTAPDSEAEELLPVFAKKLNALRSGELPEPEWTDRERVWHEDLINDYSYHRGFGLPGEWQERTSDYKGSTIVPHRGHLPDGFIVSRMFPLLVDPVSSVAQLIPASYWPDGMAAWLGNHHGIEHAGEAPPLPDSIDFLAPDPADRQEREAAYAEVFGPIVSVNHDLVFSPHHIDVYQFEWGPPRDEFAYITGGMSDAIQPAGGTFGRIEMVFYTKERHERFPRMLHAFARYPWQTGASIGPGDTIPLGDSADAMLGTDRFTALMFLPGVAQAESAIHIAPCLVASGTQIMTIVPLTAAELEFKLANDVNVFLGLFREHGFDLAFSPKRAEVVD